MADDVTLSHETNIPLMRRLLIEGASEQEILKKFTERYAAQGVEHKKDPAWVKARVDIYMKLAMDDPKVSAAVKDREPKERTDREKIEAGEWGECWICRDVFRRKTETYRYCKDCSRGWCEGWHGNFSRGFGQCIICGRKKSD